MGNGGCSRYAYAEGPLYCDVILLTVGYAFVIFVLAFVLYLCAILWDDRRRVAPDSRANHDTIVALHRGLDPKILDSIPVLVCRASPGSSTECVVCLSEIEVGEKLRVLPRCEHEFHVLCIDQWFRSATTCPVCRAVVEMAVSNGKPCSIKIAWASIVALVVSKWALIRNLRLRSGQGSETEPDLELGEGLGTSRPPLPAPSSSSSPHS